MESKRRTGIRIEETREALFRALPRYEYRGLLGQGGMAVAFRAYDRALDHEIAVKVQLTGEETSEEEMLLRMKREVSLNRRIKHPNVAQMFDFGVAADLGFITMEYIPGKNLAAVLAADGPLPVARLVPLLSQIVAGTAAAHRAAIVHRDLKPANVMVAPDGLVVILDFGLARRPLDPSITGAGILVGTLPYMAPEQLIRLHADARTDLYAIGVIAHEALTGGLPHRGSSPATLAASITQQRVPADALVAAAVPRELVAIVLRCLERDPADRYQTAEELGSGLDRLELPTLDGAAGPTPEPNRTPESSETARLTRPVEAADGNGAGTGTRESETRTGWIRPVALVVDGDAGSRAEVAATLTGSGCATLEAADGKQALEILLGRDVDLVVMDVALPRMDGFDVLRILRAQPRRGAVPVLLLSSLVGRGRIAFAHQAGATDLLEKPVPGARLVERAWGVLEHEGFHRPT